jgi:hypothetical protein
METRKRKEVPESTGEDDSEIAERPSKSREPSAKEDEETDKTKADPTEADIEASPETDAAAAAITNTIDAAALPSGTPATEPAIDAATGDPPTAPTEGVAAAAPKVLPKPSTSEELAHWNQMFFDLMVRTGVCCVYFSVLFCSVLLTCIIISICFRPIIICLIHS